MHEMRAVATDDVSVSQSVCLSRMCLRPAKAAARIEVLFEVETPWGQRNIVLDWGPDFPD